MRLIAREIHRAFPELDRFDDEKCRRFVTAAQRGKWAVLGRAIANITLSTIAFTAVTALGGVTLWLITRSETDHNSPAIDNWLFAAWVVLVSAAFTGACVLSLVLRDQLLRRRVARFIHARGKCPQCRYNLLGVRVPDSLRINCPECGLELEVDEALTELAGADPHAATPDTSPLPTAKPRERRLARTNELDRWPRWFTPKRRKRTLQTLVALVALAVTIPAAWWGWNWYALHAQAKRAAAQRIGLVGIDKLSESLNPPSDGTADAWDHFERVRQTFDQAEQEVEAAIREKYDPDISPTERSPEQMIGMVATQRPNRLFPDYSEIYAPHPSSDVPIDDRERAEAEEEHTANAELARRVLIRVQELGIDAQLESMIEAKRAVISMPPYIPGIEPDSRDPNLSARRTLVQANLARMTLAQRSGNLRDYTIAFRSCLAIIRMIERCPLLVHQLVATSAEQMVFRALRNHLEQSLDPEWLDALDTAMRELPTGTTPWKSVMDAQREYMLDTVRWLFSDPARAAMGVSRGLGMGNMNDEAAALRTGTLDENIAAINQYFDGFIARGTSPPGHRAQESPSMGTLAFGLFFSGGYDRILADRDGCQTTRAGIRLALAVELFRAKQGHPPTSLNELVPEFLPSIPQDFLAPDAQFRYRAMPGDPSNDTRPDYLLYSVGSDGEDNEGRERANSFNDFRPSATPGYDVVFHRPASYLPPAMPQPTDDQ